MKKRGEYLLNNYSRFEESFVYGEGAILYSEDRKDYIDFGSGIGVSSIGHGSKGLSRAIFDQASNLIHTSNLYHIKNQEELAEKLSNLAGFKLYSFFANSGAEANESAIKLARKYGSRGSTKRWKIITLDNSFHGRTYGSLSATAQSSFHKGFEPILDGFVYAKTLNDIQNIIDNDNEIVAVLIELVRGEGGVQALDINEVQTLAKLLKSQDILLMVDEVQSGVFRTGRFLASNLYGIEPDVITLAKGLAGGIPIGAMLTKIPDAFVPGDHGSTFGGNSFSTGASLKTLEILLDEYKSGRLARRIDFFNGKLDELIREYPHVFKSISGIGLMRGLPLDSKIDLMSIVKSANNERVLTLKSGNNTLRLLPPLTISEKEIETGFQRLSQAIALLNIC
jgi:acetylornithine aminotransferase